MFFVSFFPVILFPPGCFFVHVTGVSARSALLPCTVYLPGASVSENVKEVWVGNHDRNDNYIFGESVARQWPWAYSQLHAVLFVCLSCSFSFVSKTRICLFMHKRQKVRDELLLLPQLCTACGAARWIACVVRLE